MLPLHLYNSWNHLWQDIYVLTVVWTCLMALTLLMLTTSLIMSNLLPMLVFHALALSKVL